MLTDVLKILGHFLIKGFGFKWLFMTYDTSTHIEWPTEPNKEVEKSKVLILSRWNCKPAIQDIAIGYWIQSILISDLQGFLYS